MVSSCRASPCQKVFSLHVLKIQPTKLQGDEKLRKVITKRGTLNVLYTQNWLSEDTMMCRNVTGCFSSKNSRSRRLTGIQWSWKFILNEGRTWLVIFFLLNSDARSNRTNSGVVWWSWKDSTYLKSRRSRVPSAPFVFISMDCNGSIAALIRFVCLSSAFERYLRFTRPSERASNSQNCWRLSNTDASLYVHRSLCHFACASLALDRNRKEFLKPTVSM